MVQKSPRVFYGWLIVGACFLLSMYLSGVVFYGFTAIFKPIADEFGWSYVEVSLAASLRGMEAGFLAPLLGLVVDRWSARKLMFGGALCTALGLFLLSRMQSLGVFYFASVLTAVGSSCAGISVTTTIIGNWFRRRLGLATGLMICGHGAAGLLVPIIVRLVNLYDWRTTVLILAIGLAVLELPLTLIVRNRPEPYGLFPDGEERTPLLDRAALAAIAKEESVSAKDALRSRAFWQIIVALFPHFIIVGAVFTHVMPYLASVNVPIAVSGMVATVLPLISIAGRFGLGWGSDRFNKKMLCTGGILGLGISMALFEFVSTSNMWLLLIFSVLFGVSYGGNLAMLGILLRDYFGRGSYGTIIGVAWGILLLGNVVGPPFVGWFFDNRGSYQYSWLVLAGMTAIGSLVMLAAPEARRRGT